jgi:CBS domain-containing protein
MTSVSRILGVKPNKAVYTIEAGDAVYSALRLMAENRIGSLLVTDNGATVGIVTERDYAQKVALMGRVSRSTPVREIMSSRVLFVRPEQTSYECMTLMSQYHVRHLPVVREDSLIGMISIGDLVKDIIADQQFTIEQLERYITS